MYLTMDELGKDYVEEIKSTSGEGEKWKKVVGMALRYGFTGIQITPTLYTEQLGLSLQTYPDCLNPFRRTYHMGGVFPLASVEDRDLLNRNMERSLMIADAWGMEDVSFHPPLRTEGNERSQEYLEAIIWEWLPAYREKRIMLSVESHVSQPYFIFDGLRDFHAFINQFESLGVLIDFSHNCYDGYSVEQILEVCGDLHVTGLHLSDANPNVEFKKGTHLPIGMGCIDFAKIIGHFDHADVYGALEIKGTSHDIQNGSKIIGRLQKTC